MKRGQHTPGSVDVHVKGKNLTITPALHDTVVNKMQRLDKYLDRLQELEVELSTAQTRSAAHHNHCEAHAVVYGRVVRVTAEHNDMYAAIDEAVDKLYRQLNRTKERMKSHGAQRFVEALPMNGEEAVPELEKSDGVEPEISFERLAVKPQFPDEAILEMDALGRDFYVFLNAEDERVNILYRKKDGTYGLIEPYVQ